MLWAHMSLPGSICGFWMYWSHAVYVSKYVSVLRIS